MLETAENALFSPQKHDQFWSCFFPLSFPSVSFEMAQTFCFWPFKKGKKVGRKRGLRYIYISIYLFIYLSFSCVRVRPQSHRASGKKRENSIMADAVVNMRKKPKTGAREKYSCPPRIRTEKKPWQPETLTGFCAFFLHPLDRQPRTIPTKAPPPPSVYRQNGVDLSSFLCFACKHMGTRVLSSPNLCFACKHMGTRVLSSPNFY